MKIFSLLLLSFCMLPVFLPANPLQEQLIEKLFSNLTYDAVSLSPDGRYLATLTKMEDKRSLIVIELETGEVQGVNVDSGRDIFSFDWVSSQHILYRVSVWDRYSTGTFIYSLEDGNAESLIDFDDAKFSFSSLVAALPQDDSQFIFEGKARGTRRHYNLYRWDLKSERAQIIDEIDKEHFAIVHPQTGRVDFIFDTSGDDYRLFRKTEEGLEPVHTFDGWFRFRGRLQNPDYIVGSVLNEEGMSGMAVFNLKKMEFAGEPRFLKNYDVVSRSTSGIYDNHNNSLLGLRFHRDKPMNFWFDANLRKLESIVQKMFPGYFSSFLGFRPGPNTAVYSVFKDTAPPRLIEIDLKTGEAEVLYTMYKDVGDLEFRPTEPVVFTHEKSTYPIHGYLTLPEGDGPFPTILVAHGGPHSRDTWGFDAEVQCYALQGYAVLEVNYRGSTGYGESFQHYKKPAQIGVKSVEDLIAAARWGIAEGHADPEAIGIYGASFGGYIALAAAAEAPDLWAAAVGFAGFYDWVDLYKVDSRGNPSWVEDYYADYDETVYESLSVIDRAEQIQAPVLLIHGDADGRVPVGQSKRMHRALEKAGKESTLDIQGWGVHGLGTEKSRQEFYRQLGQFFDEHLKAR